MNRTFDEDDPVTLSERSANTEIDAAESAMSDGHGANVIAKPVGLTYATRAHASATLAMVHELRAFRYTLADLAREHGETIADAAELIEAAIGSNPTITVRRA